MKVDAAGVQTFLPVSTYDSAQQKVVPVPVSLGAETDKLYLILNGTGLRGRPGLTSVTVEVGGVAVPVFYAGAQPDFVGLDQVNIGSLPRSLAGKGEIQVVMTVDNKRSNSVTVTIQ